MRDSLERSGERRGQCPATKSGSKKFAISAAGSRGKFVIRSLRAVAAMVVAGAGSSALAQTYTETVLGSFNGTDGSGLYDADGLIQLNNTLYGAADSGGTAGGTIFSEPLSGGTPTAMYAFTNGADGKLPQAGLTLSADGKTLYGTTYVGASVGATNAGSIFSIPVSGGSPTVLYTFAVANAATYGEFPEYGSLLLSGDKLYGTTVNGGPNNAGEVYSIPTTGGTPTVLFSFNGSGAARAQPNGGLALNGSTLYGTTNTGGAYNDGFIYSLPITGGTPTTLASFNGANGARPDFTPTLSADGSTLYGVSFTGGSANDGTVFSENTSGGTINTLVSFTGNSGADPGTKPSCKLLLIGSTLYGTTQFGGSSNNDGEVFSIPVTGGTPNVLYTFSGPTTDGSHPFGGLSTDDQVTWNTNTGAWDDGTFNWNGNFYGTTQLGGTLNDGTVFQLSGPITYMDGDQVIFGSNLSVGSTITIQAGGVAPASITFNNSSGFTYNFTGGAITGSGKVTVLAGTAILSNANTYTGPTNIAGGTLVSGVAGAIPAGNKLTVGLGAAFISDSQATVSALGSLNLNGDMVVHGGSVSTITGEVAAGYNNGAWNGSGGSAVAISSSAAAGDSTHLTALGVIINDTTANTGPASGTALVTSLDGTPTVDGDILVKYTYYGDANLSGSVDGSDYSLIDNGCLQHLTGWFNGDFNYDGVVNGSDYTLIDNAFNTQGAAISTEVAISTAQIAGVSAVPEPATISMAGICVLSLLGRPRRPTGR